MAMNTSAANPVLKQSQTGAVADQTNDPNAAFRNINLSGSRPSRVLGVNKPKLPVAGHKDAWADLTDRDAWAEYTGNGALKAICSSWFARLKEVNKIEDLDQRSKAKQALTKELEAAHV